MVISATYCHVQESLNIENLKRTIQGFRMLSNRNLTCSWNPEAFPIMVRHIRVWSGASYANEGSIDVPRASAAMPNV